MLREDWETYTETLAHTAFGWAEGEEAHRFAGVLQECITPEMFLAAGEDIHLALAEFKVPQNETEEFMCIILSFKDDVVTM